MSAKQHNIKVLPRYFDKLYNPETCKGVKRFELRLNDRNYEVGDTVILEEYDDLCGYTGNKITVTISYVLQDCPQYGLFNGYCIFCW